MTDEERENSEMGKEKSHNTGRMLNPVLVCLIAVIAVNSLVICMQSILGHYAIYCRSMATVLLCLLSVVFSIGFFIKGFRKEKNHFHFLLAITLPVLSIIMLVMTWGCIKDCTTEPLAKATEYYTVGDKVVILYDIGEEIPVVLSARQKEYMKMNEPQMSEVKGMYVAENLMIYAHEEKLEVVYYPNTMLAKSVKYENK